MFLRVVDTIVTQEKIDEEIDYDKETDGELLSEAEQSEYDVLYGDTLQRSPE